jgi:hypothetical protein
MMADKELPVEQRIKTALFFTETRSVVATVVDSCQFSNAMGAFIQNNS